MATSAFDDDIRKLVRSQAKALSRKAGSAFGARTNTMGGGALAGRGGPGRDRFTSEKESYSLNVNVTAVGFTVLYNVLVSPMNDTLFPGQVYLAQAHGEYKFSKLSIDFRTSVTPYTTPNGRIWMMWLPDATATVPTTLAGIETISHKICAPAYKDTTLTVPSSLWLKTGASTDGGQAPNLLYHGRLIVVSDCAAATGTVGTLRVKSSVDFQDYRVPPLPVAPLPVASLFQQVNMGAKPIFANNIGTAFYPGDDGNGVITSLTRTGWFSDAHASVNGANNRLLCAFSTADMPIGTVLQVTRMGGRAASDATYIRLPLWENAGGAPAVLDGSAQYGPGLNKYFFNPFGPSAHAASTVSQPENPAGSDLSVTGNQVAIMTSICIVVENTAAVAISFGLPSVQFGDAATNYDSCGWSLAIAVIAYHPQAAADILAEQAADKRQPWQDRFDAMPAEFRKAIEAVPLALEVAPHVSPAVLRGESASNLRADGGSAFDGLAADADHDGGSSDEDDFREAATKCRRGLGAVTRV